VPNNLEERHGKSFSGLFLFTIILVLTATASIISIMAQDTESPDPKRIRVCQGTHPGNYQVIEISENGYYENTGTPKHDHRFIVKNEADAARCLALNSEYTPTDPPTDYPTNPPTIAPTDPPTDYPTNPPTIAPTDPPTNYPTNPPTIDIPTDPPTIPTTPVPIVTTPASIVTTPITIEPTTPVPSEVTETTTPSEITETPTSDNLTPTATEETTEIPMPEDREGREGGESNGNTYNLVKALIAIPIALYILYPFRGVKVKHLNCTIQG
jgi:hypothetical protein